jgi:hypothetical protein
MEAGELLFFFCHLVKKKAPFFEETGSDVGVTRTYHKQAHIIFPDWGAGSKWLTSAYYNYNGGVCSNEL